MPNPSEVSPAMTAEERVKELYPDARILLSIVNDKYFVTTKRGIKGVGGRLSEYCSFEKQAWESAASRLPASPVAARTILCINCGQSKRKHTKANRGKIWYCSGGGMWTPETSVVDPFGIESARNIVSASPVAEGESQTEDETEICDRCNGTGMTKDYEECSYCHKGAR